MIQDDTGSGAPPPSPGPLHGLRVVDLATERAELAGRVLADLGAEVVKVEPPGGAHARFLPPFERGQEGSPDGSLYWAAVGLGKRNVVLDLHGQDGRRRLRQLAAGADVLIESFDPGTLDALGFGYAALRLVNRGLVYVSVTPFGIDGPRAHTPASELTLEAAGGLLGLQGDGDRPPVPAGFPQAAFHAGVQAAADAVVALNAREHTGAGQHLDVSMQAAVVWALMNATGFPPNTGSDPPHTGSSRAVPRPILPEVPLPAQTVWEAADGHVLARFQVPGIEDRALQLILRWVEEEAGLPEGLRGRDWQHWRNDILEGQLDTGELAQALDCLARFLRTRTKREVMDRAVRDKVNLAPVYTTADLLDDPQLKARDYWQQVGGRTHPGPFARCSGTPLRLGARAPLLAEALPGEPATIWKSHLRPGGREGQVPGGLAGPAAATGAFTGIKVADFSWVGVGPLIAKTLADHGATAVRVESAAHPDYLRLLPPFKDRLPGLDRSQFFANFNTSKLGLALDFGTDAGLELAHRLIRWSDVVIESFSPGTLERHGLDYASVSQDRPDLIMLSTSLRGQTGPERGFSGFGSQGVGLAGLHGITGWPDRPPAGPWGAYTDFVANRYGVAVLAAAILHRSRTGRGQHIDLSQVEAAIHFIEPLVLDYTVNGRVAQRAGQDSDRHCPHGAYQTAGAERYVAVAVETAEQWKALRTVAPLEGFGSPGFASLEERLRHRDAIDVSLRAWARTQEPWRLAATLQEAGVPAFVVQRPADLYDDPQLTHRGFFVTLAHREMGPTPYDGPVTLFSETPPRLRCPAPCLGQDTETVLRELLGLTAGEVQRYAEAGALT